MGNTWMIHVYNEEDEKERSCSYCAYSGESWIKALFVLWLQKGRNAGCVKLEWR